MIPRIGVSVDKATKKHILALLNAEKNIRSALSLFTKSVADIVHDELEDASGAADYSKLKVAHFGEVGRYSVTALVLPDSLRVLDKADEWRTVVTAIPTDHNSSDQMALKSGSPWLPEMLPSWAKDSVRLVSRRVSADEVDAILEKIADDKKKVDLLVGWGKVKPGSPSSIVAQVRKLAFPLGLEVQEDIAWRVLRQEYGLHGEPHLPHWRNATKLASDPGVEMLKLFWMNLLGEDHVRVQKDVALSGKMEPVENFQAFVSGDKVPT